MLIDSLFMVLLCVAQSPALDDDAATVDSASTEPESAPTGPATAPTGPATAPAESESTDSTTTAPVEPVSDDELPGATEAGSAVAETGEDESAPVEPAPVTEAVEATPLRIRSTPSGATVYVDGVELGTTPFEKVLEPGDRLIEVHKEGHVDYSDFVTIDPSTPSDPIEVTLAVKPSSFPYEPLGWTGVGVGAAALISGIALIAIDENPYKGQCDGVDIDSAGRCRFRYDTLAGGITGVIVGAALAGGGAALLVIGRKRGRQKAAPKDSARAHLRWGVSARGISLSGRF